MSVILSSQKREAVFMTSSKLKAIRITIITVAVSMVLSAACCAAFFLNLTGLMRGGDKAAAAHSSVPLSVVMSAEDAEGSVDAFPICVGVSEP